MSGDETPAEAQAREAAFEAIRTWVQEAWPEDTGEVISEFAVVFAVAKYEGGRPSSAVGVLLGPDFVAPHRAEGLLRRGVRHIEGPAVVICGCGGSE